MWRIWRAPTNASVWQIGFNSVFKGLTNSVPFLKRNEKKFLFWDSLGSEQSVL
jgi:hypothetical protein